MKPVYVITCFSLVLTACAAPEIPELPEVPAALPVFAAPGRPALPAEPIKLAQAPSAPAPKAELFFPRSRGGRTLIIQSSDPDPKTYANLEEDLNVMYRILSKTRRQDEGSFKLDSFLSSSSSSVRSMYIEGYGAVFMLGVRFPLVAPQTREEQPKPKDTTSEEWERAKRELYSRNVFEVDVEHIWTKALGPHTEEYDAQKVEDLTTGILEAMKNATHIRNLKPDEYVTVAVLGAEAGQARAVVEKDDRDEDGKVKRRTRVESVSSGRGESTMTIRAKRSDIEDFAKAKLNLEGFRKKAKILVYLRPADPSADMDVFIQPPPRR